MQKKFKTVIIYIMYIIFKLTEATNHAPSTNSVKIQQSNLPDFFSIYGEHGRNYFIDEKNQPYILCEYYNTDECSTEQSDSRCSYVKKCYGESRTHGLRCMAALVFDSSIKAINEMLASTNTSGNTFNITEHLQAKATRKDCWTQSTTELSDCETEDQCIAEHRSTRNSGSAAIFCCCKTHLCNKNTSYKVHPFSEPEPEFIWINNTDTIIWTIMTALLFLSVCIACIFLVYIVKKKVYIENIKTTNLSDYNLKKNQGTDEGKTEIMKSTYKTSEINSTDDECIGLINGKSANLHDFKILQLISSGRFGAVHKAKVGNVTVAAKMFPAADVDSWICEQDLYSVEALRSHPNISSFFAAFPRDNYFWLLTYYCRNGSLYNYLKNHKLSLQDLSTIVYTMLNGIAFLHEEIRSPFLSKPSIVHRDLKSKNVLIKDDLTACITDFGLAIKCEARRIAPDGTQGQVGTRRYMSPELLEGAMEFSSFAFQQADVYAASLVIWELLSQTLLPNESAESVGDYYLPYEIEIGRPPSLGEIRDLVVIQKYRPQLRTALHTNEFTNAIVKTMAEMWEKEPDARITSGCARDRIFRINKAIIRYYNITKNGTVTPNNLDSMSPEGFSLVNNS